MRSARTLARFCRGSAPRRLRANRRAGSRLIAISRLAPWTRRSWPLQRRLKVTEIATLDHRHFSVVRPNHVDAFELLPWRRPVRSGQESGREDVHGRVVTARARHHGPAGAGHVVGLAGRRAVGVERFAPEAKKSDATLRAKAHEVVPAFAKMPDPQSSASVGRPPDEPELSVGGGAESESGAGSSFSLRTSRSPPGARRCRRPPWPLRGLLGQPPPSLPRARPG